MSESRHVKKDDFIKIGGDRWFDKSQAKLIIDYVATVDNFGTKKHELFQLPSGIYIAHVWIYSEGGPYSDYGSWSDEWKQVVPSDPDFVRFVDYMDPIPAEWITRKEIV